MLDLDPEIVLFDTEFTAWEGSWEGGWSKPGEYREIIQIGAVILETTDFRELDHLLLYVKPQMNPELSGYIMKLTSITQEDIDAKGTAFKEALERFSGWAGGRKTYCWGSDTLVMKENAALVGVPFPQGLERWGNAKDIFRSAGIDVGEVISSQVPILFGETPPPNAHDALNDARSIAQGLRALSRWAKARA